jgi:hypothetical protein
LPISLDPEGQAAYVSDGWGVAYAALRLRKLDLATGVEMATARLGNQVRCVAFSMGQPGAVLAATDTKLFLLDRVSLAVIRRWDHRIPRYTDMMIWHDDQVLMANGRHHVLDIFDLTSGRVRRRPFGPYLRLFDKGDYALISSGGVGKIWRLPFNSMTPIEVVATPPFMDVAIDSHDNLWLAVGAQVVGRGSTNSPGQPTRRLEGYRLSDGQAIGRHQLPFDVRDIAISPEADELWAPIINERLVGTPNWRPHGISVRSLPNLHESRSVELQANEWFYAMFPERKVAFAQRWLDAWGPSELTCVEV